MQVSRNWRYPAFIVAFIFLALEALLRVFGVNDTYMEMIGKDYFTYWGVKHDTWYWTSAPNFTYTEKNIDFAYAVKTNSLGHRELEPTEIFNDGPRKVVAVGDSYTEGIGVVYDSSWVRHLQNISRISGVPLSLYNAGVSGNDPLYSFTIIRDKFMQYRPDIIITTFNHSDYTDIIYRGGFERFLADSTTLYKKGPWFEPVYRYSYIFRAVLHGILGFTNGDLFMKEQEFKDECIEINRQFVAVADSLYNLSIKNNFKMLFVFHAGCDELTYDSNINRYSKKLFEHLHEELRGKGYFSINLWESMDKVINEDNRLFYGFEHDGHFSSAGYKLMAQVIWEETWKYFPGFWTTGNNIREGSNQSAEITPE